MRRRFDEETGYKSPEKGEKIRILVTNDDGIYSPGLQALAEGLQTLGDVYVIAPDRERSAVGHSFSMHHPLRIIEIRPNQYSVDGTPTDCVMCAGLGYLKERPHVVVSGINLGPNLGDDVTYSGTVSAALEGTILGIPSIAVSASIGPRAEKQIGKGPDFSAGVGIVRNLVPIVLERGFPEGMFLNVNVPNLSWEEVQGVDVTHLGKRVYRDRVIRRQDPHGREYFWIGGETPTHVPEEGSDFDAIEAGRISITPISFRLTAADYIEELKSWPLMLHGRTPSA